MTRKPKGVNNPRTKMQNTKDPKDSDSSLTPAEITIDTIEELKDRGYYALAHQVKTAHIEWIKKTRRKEAIQSRKQHKELMLRMAKALGLCHKCHKIVPERAHEGIVTCNHCLAIHKKYEQKKRETHG
jgi:ribosomal protein L37AE/L43A